jgi:glyoxylase I family protein
MRFVYDAGVEEPTVIESDEPVSETRYPLSHVDLTVNDLKSSMVFYDSVLGRLGYRRLDGAGAGVPCWGVADAHGGFFTIALKPARPEWKGSEHNECAPGLHHVAFRADSRDDVNEFHAFLMGSGVTILDPPAEYGYSPGYYALFFRDPDGIKLGVVFEPEPRGRTTS